MPASPSRLGSSHRRRASMKREVHSLHRLDRVLLAATDGDVPSTSAAPPVLWCRRITMQFSGRCEGSSFLRGDGSRAALHGGLHPASSSERTRSPWQWSAARRGRRGRSVNRYR